MIYLNKDLLDSLNTNELIIDLCDEEFIDINRIIDFFRSKYNQELDNIYSNSSRNIYSLYNHCNLVRDIIGNILQHYDVIKKYDVCAFVTGSFARCSCKKNSDIDFHLLYSNEYKDILFKYEEIIYYIISSVFDLHRSKVHSMVVSRLSSTNVNYLDSILDD